MRAVARCQAWRGPKACASRLALPSPRPASSAGGATRGAASPPCADPVTQGGRETCGGAGGAGSARSAAAASAPAPGQPEVKWGKPVPGATSPSARPSAPPSSPGREPRPGAARAGAGCAFARGARAVQWGVLPGVSTGSAHEVPVTRAHTQGSQVTRAHTQGSLVAVGTREADAPLPLPPRSPPAAGRAPSAGLGDQSRERRRGRAPSPSLDPSHKAPSAAEGHSCRRMRFWLRHEEMALEEMVRRLNAVSTHTGRRGCGVGVLGPDIMRPSAGSAPGVCVAAFVLPAEAGRADGCAAFWRLLGLRGPSARPGSALEGANDCGSQPGACGGAVCVCSPHVSCLSRKRAGLRVERTEPGAGVRGIRGSSVGGNN